MNALADLDAGAFLDALADRIAERVAIHLAKPHDDLNRWLTTREAAEHLGMHPDTLGRRAAAGTIPNEQEGPGCPRYFLLSELDRWREPGCPRRPHDATQAPARLPRPRKAA
jgi:hypothetical protein